MDKRKAIATAGAVTLTAIAGALAIAANLGLLSANADEGVGDVTPVTDGSGSPEPKVVTVFVDDPATQAGSEPVEIVVTEEPSPRPISTADDHDRDDDDAFDDNGGDRDDDREDGSEDEHAEDEHEGREDDD